ncbi:RodZ domain-containing protein [Herminiimonas arsenitoxidans]|uniref:RodZ domain-containing protein n=1 Tax=Herminiimonas arsenitoxidans TaxID=1809410 RepID=UPI0009709D4D|nr:RodZ domain-containing protein [Herminiimonas arsenitoxidans]
MNDDVPVNETMNNDAAPEQAPEVENLEPRISAGMQLRALREERGWTVEQVANQLNLASRQIQALEDDNYAALPGMVIVRGFIRSYSKVLRVDPAPILAAIKDDTAAPSVLPPERSPLSASFSETRLLSVNQRGIRSKAVIGIGILVALAVLAYAGQRMGLLPHGASTSGLSKVEEKLAPIELAETQSDTVVETPPVLEEVIEAKATDTKPVEAKVVEVAKPVSEPTPPVAATKPQAVVAPVVSAVVAAPTAKPVPTTAPVPATPVDSKNALAINVRQDSWVEIKRPDNSVIVSRLMKAGSSEAIAVTGPVSVVIGNAAGVDVTLRGDPVDVVTGNSSNVARLNLK